MRFNCEYLYHTMFLVKNKDELIDRMLSLEHNINKDFIINNKCYVYIPYKFQDNIEESQILDLAAFKTITYNNYEISNNQRIIETSERTLTNRNIIINSDNQYDNNSFNWIFKYFDKFSDYLMSYDENIDNNLLLSENTIKPPCIIYDIHDNLLNDGSDLLMFKYQLRNHKFKVRNISGSDICKLYNEADDVILLLYIYLYLGLLLKKRGFKNHMADFILCSIFSDNSDNDHKYSIKDVTCSVCGSKVLLGIKLFGEYYVCISHHPVANVANYLIDTSSLYSNNSLTPIHKFYINPDYKNIMASDKRCNILLMDMLDIISNLEYSKVTINNKCYYKFDDGDKCYILIADNIICDRNNDRNDENNDADINRPKKYYDFVMNYDFENKYSEVHQIIIN